MKTKIFSAITVVGYCLLAIGMVSCSDKLDVSDPNQQTSETFGKTAEELEECVIACYNHIRMEGTYARVGYNYDVCRGDEVWNSSQVWYLPYDDFNSPVTNEMNQWPWRDWYYTINVCNFILSRVSEDNSSLSDRYKRIKGQALFIRGLAYYNLTGYYQNPALITDYSTYQTLDGLYVANVSDGDADSNVQYDRVLDQVEKDFSEAMTLLPAKTIGGEWSKGRATSGAAAGYYARTLMVRHKYSEALAVLKDIMSTADGGNQLYGEYKLMDNYGDNFREGTDFENNDESLFEVQFLDNGSQGTDDEWTPVTPHRLMPLRATSLLVIAAVGLTCRLPPGSIICLRLSVPQVTRLTPVFIGRLVPTSLSGTDMSLAIRFSPPHKPAIGPTRTIL